MNKQSRILHSRIVSARKYNTYGTLLLLVVLAFVSLSNDLFNVSWAVSGVITILSLMCGFFFQDILQGPSIVKCPRCDVIVEKGKMLGSPMPEVCEKCGLAVTQD